MCVCVCVCVCVEVEKRACIYIYMSVFMTSRYVQRVLSSNSKITCVHSDSLKARKS